MSTVSFDYYYGNESEQFIFYRIPKLLFTDDRFSELSIEAKVLYGIMLDRMGLSIKNKWFDEQKRVYIVFTVDKIMDLLHCREQKANKLLKDLEEIGLIEKRRNGLGKPNFIYIKNFLGFYKKNDDGMKKTVETPENSENETEIAEEIEEETDYFSEQNDENLPKSQMQNCENHNSRNVKITNQELPKSQNTDTFLTNDTDFSKNPEKTEQFSEQKQQNDENLQQSQMQKCENHNSRNVKITNQELPKSQTINTLLINDTDFSNTDFNDTKKINHTVSINNNQYNPSYPSHLSKTDEMDEIDTIIYSDTEKKEEEKCTIDKELEEQLYKSNNDELPYDYPKCLINLQREVAQKKLKEQQQKVEKMNDTTNTNTEEKPKPKQQFFIDKGLQEQMCKATILRNINYRFLAENERTKYNIQLINNMVDIMVSVIISNKTTIRISGEEIPQQMVKERLLKLNSEHITYVLECLNRTKNKIHNIRAYYISALYNAPETIDAYYQAEVNYDMYR